MYFFLIWEVLYTWVVICGVGFFCWFFLKFSYCTKNSS